MPRFVEPDPPRFVKGFGDRHAEVRCSRFAEVSRCGCAAVCGSGYLPTDPPDSSEPPSISLADLKDAGITFEEDDAVAIGQALCRAYMTARVLHRIIPESGVAGVSSPVTLDTVFLEASGHVSVTVQDPHDVPLAIQSIGNVLSDILPPDEDLFLRKKIISKALASPPQFVTLDELAKALALYERPDRRQLIQALYARGEKRPLPRTPVVKAIVPFTTPPAWTPPPKKIVPPRSRYQPIAVAAAIAAILVIGIWRGVRGGSIALGHACGLGCNGVAGTGAGHSRGELERLDAGPAAGRTGALSIGQFAARRPKTRPRRTAFAFRSSDIDGPTAVEHRFGAWGRSGNGGAPARSRHRWRRPEQR